MADAALLRRALSLLDLSTDDFRADCGAFGQEQKLLARLKTDAEIQAHRETCKSECELAKSAYVAVLAEMLATQRFVDLDRVLLPWFRATFRECGLDTEARMGPLREQYYRADSDVNLLVDRNCNANREIQELHQNNPRVFAK